MQFFGVPMWMVLVWLFVLGTVFGSFLNVCVYRIPQHLRLRDQIRGLWSPPSRCPRCGTQIAKFDNVPVLGWLWLRGRCRTCRLPISIRYPLVELANGLLLVLLYWFEVPGGFDVTVHDGSLFTPLFAEPTNDWSAMTWLNVRFFYHVVLVEALLVASLIDIDLQIIPDASTLPAMVIGVVVAAATGQVFLVPIWFQDPSMMRTLAELFPSFTSVLSTTEVPEWTRLYPHWHGLAVSLAGLVVGGGSIWIVRILGHWILRQEAMGFGDVILMAMIGSFLGWQPTLVVFFIAPACALAVIAVSWIFRRQREIPYGPYLSLATLILLLFWQQIWPVAERWFDLGPLVPITAVCGIVMLAGSLQLVQLGKRALGIPMYPSDTVEEWTSADQLSFLAGETVDVRQGQWRTNDWPGTLSGRGVAHEDVWRRGTNHQNSALLRGSSNSTLK